MAKRKFLAKILLIILLFNAFYTFAVRVDDPIRLILVGRDSRSGMQITPDFVVKSVNGGFNLPVVREGNNLVVKVDPGDKVRITANLDGYYPDEKTYDIDDLYDEDDRNIVFQMDPMPSANVTLTVVDKASGKPVDASIELLVDGKVVKTVNQDRKTGQVTAVLSLPGEYTLRATSATAGGGEATQTIDVNDPPLKFSKTIEVSKAPVVEAPKPPVPFTLTVVDAVTRKPIEKVNITLTEAGGNAVTSTPKKAGTWEITPPQSNSLTIKTAADGYRTKEETLNVTEKTYQWTLEPVARIAIDVSAVADRQPIMTDVTIETPDKKTVVIRTDDKGKAFYYPETKGIYTLNITKTIYQDARLTVNVDALERKNYEASLQLLPGFEEYKVIIVDENKKPIEQSAVLILTKDSNTVDAYPSGKTGEWTAKLLPTDPYTYTAKAVGYNDLEGFLDLKKGKTIYLQMARKITDVLVQTVDKYTLKPVKSVISYPGMPENQKGKALPAHTLKIPVGETLKPVLSAEGYADYEMQPIKNETNAEVLMLADTYPIFVEIRDSETNDLIKPDYVSVLNKESSVPYVVNELTPTFTLDLPAEEEFYVNVRKAGYNEHSSPFLPAATIQNDKSKKVIVLSKKAYLTQLVKIVDSQTGEVLPDATLSVTTQSGEKVEPQKDRNQWKADVKNGQTFTLAAASPGYVEVTESGLNFSVEPLTLKLTKIQTTEQQFTAYDTFLKKLVPAKFTLMTDEKMADLPTTQQRTVAQAPLELQKSYTIRISAPDYRDKEESFTFNKQTANPLQINFVRKFYPIRLQLQTSDGQPIAAVPELRISQDGKYVKSGYNAEKQLANFDASPEFDVIYEIETAGFLPTNGRFALTEIAESELTKTVTLEKEKVAPPVVVVEEEKKVEPEVPEVVIVEPPAPPAEEVPAPVAEVPAPDVYEQNRENLAELPETAEGIKEALTDKEAVGKRYILTQVYFNQSTALMRDNFNEQLENIIGVLKGNPNLKIELVGHTDNVGDSRQNQYLSVNRAKVVSNYLYNKGVEDDRILTKGMGDKYPVEPNTSEENRSKNRRVELVVIEN